MKIEFVDGKMKITHPSGHVDELLKKDLEIFKNYLLARKEELNNSIAKVEQDISKL